MPDENKDNIAASESTGAEPSVDELIDDALRAAQESAEGCEEDDEASEYNDTATEFAALEDALSEANDKYLRLFAEYDNYRKRTAREKTETFANASAKVIEDLLPVIDSFERALESECSDENFKSGMNMIFGQLKTFLEKVGVTEIEALGLPFDPTVHNAIQQQSGTDTPSGCVSAVFQKGYRLGDKLIRPAMVAVAI